MTKIQELKKLTPQQRADCLERLYKKNKAFFCKKYPSVGAILRPGDTAPFRIHVTREFLKITNEQTGELCHPEVGLARFAETLGDWAHDAWVDLIEGRIQAYLDTGKYSQFPVRFQREIVKKFPGLSNRMNHRLINLPTLPSGKRFSNSVAFMGLFSGLHIDHYLRRTQLSNVLFVEPDPAQFALSCYFLDYQAIEKRFGDLLLHVGDGLPDNSIDMFFKKAHITGSVWVRVLPGYASEKMGVLLDKVRLKSRQFYDVWHPTDWQLDGMRHAMENVNCGGRIISAPVTLSSASRIAVIGAGPSLSKDLDWLKQNQDQVVIFSVHAAVSALQKAGIKPDFQFSLDINPWSDAQLERLQLDPSVPIVTLVNDVPGKFNSFQEVLLLPENGGFNPVKFDNTIPFLSPTTGNMALAFACWCSPRQIYLFGLDFGFKEVSKTHVAESSAYQSETEHRSVLASGHLPVEPNFSGSEIVTQPYFSLARISAQNPIAFVAAKVNVFNCSDGARIEGAAPCDPSQFERRTYDDKAKDIDLIRSGFVSMEKGVHWRPLTMDGNLLLEEFKKVVLSELVMSNFNWLAFTQKIDEYRQTIIKALPKSYDRDYDRRLAPYLQITDVILNCWYRLLCFTNDAQEQQQVYDEGYAQFSALIDEMEWLEDL